MSCSPRQPHGNRRSGGSPSLSLTQGSPNHARRLLRREHRHHKRNPSRRQRRSRVVEGPSLRRARRVTRRRTRMSRRAQKKAASKRSRSRGIEGAPRQPRIGSIARSCNGGDQVLRVIGKRAAAKGIIEPAAMPAAIMAIEEAIAQEEAQRRKADAQAVAEGRTPSRADGVTLRLRRLCERGLCGSAWTAHDKENMLGLPNQVPKAGYNPRTPRANGSSRNGGWYSALEPEDASRSGFGRLALTHALTHASRCSSASAAGPSGRER